MPITNERAKLLWSNARDSIGHALEHFSELSRSKGKDYHNRKWIILSVHHSAEIFTYMLLKEFDENNQVFYRKNKHYYPGLLKAVKVLLHPNFAKNITIPEKKLLELFRKLDEPRNKIIHGEIPENVDVSIMAMALVGISRISQKRCGESADDIVQQDPTILRDVVEVIRWSKLEEYNNFIESFIHENTEDIYIRRCPYCNAIAVVGRYCEGCFMDLKEIECPHCKENVLIVSENPFAQDCTECGKKMFF